MRRVRYRVFYFEDHCLTGTVEFEAPADIEAVVIASRSAGNAEFELWRGEERLRALPPAPGIEGRLN